MILLDAKSPKKRTLIESRAKEKLLADVVALGYLPIEESVRVIWMTENHGQISVAGRPMEGSCDTN